MNTHTSEECPNCGRPKLAEVRYCERCRRAYEKGHAEGFEAGMRVGQDTFTRTLEMVFGPRKERES